MSVFGQMGGIIFHMDGKKTAFRKPSENVLFKLKIV